MAVLKTTSPAVSPGAPKASPRKTVPSSSARIASATGLLLPLIARERAVEVEGRAPVDERQHRSPTQGPAVKRRVGRLGGAAGTVDLDLAPGVDDRHVGRSADLEGPHAW